jgi:hypothetical protein
MDNPASLADDAGPAKGQQPPPRDRPGAVFKILAGCAAYVVGYSTVFVVGGPLAISVLDDLEGVVGALVVVVFLAAGLAVAIRIYRWLTA